MLKSVGDWRNAGVELKDILVPEPGLGDALWESRPAGCATQTYIAVRERSTTISPSFLALGVGHGGCCR